MFKGKSKILKTYRNKYERLKKKSTYHKPIEKNSRNYIWLKNYPKGYGITPKIYSSWGYKGCLQTTLEPQEGSILRKMLNEKSTVSWDENNRENFLYNLDIESNNGLLDLHRDMSKNAHRNIILNNKIWEFNPNVMVCNGIFVKTVYLFKKMSKILPAGNVIPVG